MLTPVTRKEVFRNSAFNDHLIASFQESYGGDLNLSIPEELQMFRRYYDHMKPYNIHYNEPKGFGAIAYKTNHRSEYLQQFPVSLKELLLSLGIEKMYLLYFNAMNIFTEFPFENFTRRNRFKRMGAVKDESIAYLFQTKHITEILPLFFFSGVYDVPVIFFLSANENMPLSLRLCDDGNLHLNYELKHEEILESAAQRYGFETGDSELCSKYSICFHTKG